MTGFLSIFLRSHGGLPAGAPLLRGRSLSLHRTQPIRLVAHFRAHRLHDRRLAFTRSSVIGEEQVLCDHVCIRRSCSRHGSTARVHVRRLGSCRAQIARLGRSVVLVVVSLLLTACCRDGIYPHESGHGRDAGFWYITRRSICADLRRL